MCGDDRRGNQEELGTVVTRQEARDEITYDLRSTKKYTEAQIAQQVAHINYLTKVELEAFMLLYRHNRETIPKEVH